MYTDEAFAVYQAYQLSIHKEKKESRDQFEGFLCQVPLFDPEDQNIPENATDEEKQEYFKEQQNGSARKVSGENMKKPDGGRVLKNEGLWPKFKGGYHMLHKIDGKLFAVGVLDFTPEALSSVYLFYDPEYAFLSPGNLCTLKEIEYT